MSRGLRIARVIRHHEAAKAEQQQPVAEPKPSPAAASTLKVADLMNSKVVTVEPDTSVAAAAARMVEARVGSAIVRQGSMLIGILTERDVLRCAANGGDLSSTLVSAWMTKDPISAIPDMSADEAARLMMRNGFRHLPVVEGREICGVISQRELFAARIKRPHA